MMRAQSDSQSVLSSGKLGRTEVWAPPMPSSGCQRCIAGDGTGRHAERVSSFFSRSLSLTETLLIDSSVQRLIPRGLRDSQYIAQSLELLRRKDRRLEETTNKSFGTIAKLV